MTCRSHIITFRQTKTKTTSNNSYSSCSVSELTWAKVGLVGDPSSPLSFSTLLGWLEGLDIMLEENTSSRVLLTDGRVL